MKQIERDRVFYYCVIIEIKKKYIARLGIVIDIGSIEFQSVVHQLKEE